MNVQFSFSLIAESYPVRIVDKAKIIVYSDF
ncbi:MAG: hypothetical protein H6Q43_383 [Deltaproteobacteria bacterium]|nr:hypothetical protein [Deltaproteobacteria bacterium]